MGVDHMTLRELMLWTRWSVWGGHYLGVRVRELDSSEFSWLG